MARQAFEDDDRAGQERTGAIAADRPRGVADGEPDDAFDEHEYDDDVADEEDEDEDDIDEDEG